MLCEACGKKEANFYYKTNINGKIIQKHLCSECAEKQGLGFEAFGFATNPLFSAFDGDEGFLGEFLGGLISDKPQIRQASICPSCGMRFSEFMQSGKAGCAECYNTFREELMPTIIKLHGNVVHCGKTPRNFEKADSFGSDTIETNSKETKLSKLKAELSEAIEKQEYEQAAKLRDEIRDLEKNDNESSGGDKK